jgi:hypothetical protein
MARLREPLRQTPKQRLALAASGVALVGLGVLLLFFGGLLLLYPAGMVALALAILPARWPVWRGVAAGLVAAVLLFAGFVAFATGDAEESCLYSPGTDGGAGTVDCD